MSAPHPFEDKVRLAASRVPSELSTRNSTMMTVTPVVLGHEGAGVVDALSTGDGARSVIEF